MADVYDTWHKSRPKPGERTCPEHDKVPTKQHGVGKRWMARWRDPEGCQRKERFDKKGDAERKAAAAQADVQRGTYVDPAAGKVTFRTYAEQWLAAQTFDVTSLQNAEMHLRRHVYPMIGSKQLRHIKPSTIQAWLRTLDMSGTYKRMVFGDVSSIMNAAVDDDLIAKNPCRAGSVRAPKKDTHKIVPWPAERIAAVTTTLPGRYQISATLGAGLGLRQGEIFGLSPDDVDFLRGKVEVLRQVREFADGRLSFRPPKGGKTRTIPLPESVALRLSAHMQHFPPVEVTLPWGTPDGEPVTVSLFLTTEGGESLSRKNFNRQVWDVALAAAGVETGTRKNGMHALRHYYASVLLDAGESIKAVAEYLGHSDPGFTLRTYTHLMPSSEERTRKAIDAALNSCARVVPTEEAR